ncbi:MAG: histidinol-phosphate transaminase [Pseudanabaenaceae cyanobacterium SKYGB_i_bin29]|nr:histidinol-phosphate transaminase [Pseudanabaenaceae cyanobacterium SKYG29]MDW8420947.1 histidinol-phosphate transaminase [Pseudanabaenaceae cyanobacterium SKYGB_i_bin29]
MDCIRSDLLQLTPYSAEHYDEVEDKLDANEVAVDLPLPLKQKLAQELTDRLSTNRYPDGSYTDLRQAVSEYAGVGREWISLGNGSDELIRSVLIASCLGKGGILIATPTFSMYSILAQTLGIPVHIVGRSEVDFTIDIAAAQHTIKTEKIAAVFVVHPNSPTGNLLSKTEIEWLRSLPREILVVVDEAYYEFAGHSLVGEIGEQGNWVILRTFSKAWRLAAFRLGYAIADPAVIRVLETIRLPYNLPTITAIGGELVLAHRQELLSLVEEIRQEREKLYQALQKLPQLQVWQSEANFLYVRTPDDRKLQQHLAQVGTLIRHTGGGLRITIGTPAQNQRTIERIYSFYKG